LRAALLAAAALLFLALPAAAQTALPLQTSALQLNPEDRTQDRVGALHWRGGLAVTAEDARFGGLSDLELSADGKDLTAITDSGRWLSASLAYDTAGYLAGIDATAWGVLRDPQGRILSGKRRQDAEALARLADGSLLVGFERDHRLLRYPGGHLGGPGEGFAAPPGIWDLAANGGIEALLALPDGRLLAFTEGHRAGDSYAVYLRGSAGAWERLGLKPSGLFVPTGAALLPSGDVLLLERRFTLLGGLGARLSRIPSGSIRPGVVLESEEIAELRPPLTLDNFEGVAVHQAPDGTTRITLLSDDNFSALQRTLIVQFELVID
jgi:hypothetical protein